MGRLRFEIDMRDVEIVFHAATERLPGEQRPHDLRLVDTGLVTQERQGTTLICRAHYPAMDSLLGFLVEECCADSACDAVASDAAA